MKKRTYTGHDCWKLMPFMFDTRTLSAMKLPIDSRMRTDVGPEMSSK